MLANYIRYGSRQTFASLSRNRWLAVASAGVVVVALVILGAFLLLAVNINQFMARMGSSVEVNVFLEEGADTADLRRRLDDLEAVSSYAYIDRHDGLLEFGRSLGDTSLLEGLQGDNNPLPDIFRVQVRSADLVPEVAAMIGRFPGVEKADFGGELVDWLVRIAGWINVFSLVTGAMLAAAAVFLIVTTIRLSVTARSEEVGIMKYLGASNWYVRLPFILEGTIIGLAGTLVAVGLLHTGYGYLAAALSRANLAFFLQPVTDAATLALIFGGLLLLGVFIGGAGSFLAVRKFLRVYE